MIASLLVSSVLSVAAPAGPTIVDTAVADGRFKTLVAAVQAAELADTLQGPGPFTVFAPTDEAFAKLPDGTVEMLLKPENKGKLQGVLLYHVVPGKMMASDVLAAPGLVTANGQRLAVSATEGPRVDKSKIVITDIETSNGVIHVIDAVALPTSMNIPQVANEAGTFKTLLAAAKAGGMVGALSGKGPITVFAPTDEAFAKLPDGTVEYLLKPENKDALVEILSYHVVPGRIYSDAAVKAGSAKTLQGSPVKVAVRSGKAFANESEIVAMDIDATNGVIHVVDAVMLPPKVADATSE